jgi:hypothetical protein
MLPLISALTPILGNVLDKVIPDPAEREKAKAQMARMQQEGNLRELEHQLSAIVMEAQSADPWTSRARPSFLYVVYAYLMAAIPMGIMFAFHPESASAVTDGVRQWLAAIPGEMWALFGVGYLGYTGARSYDKRKLVDRR